MVLFSLESNIAGNFNTAIGAGTLLSNTVDNNTATGAGALLSNTTGDESVPYEQINAMLLNEFLKEHRKVEEQGAMIARQQKQIEALSSGLDNMNAQLATASLPLRTADGIQASKPGTRTASE